jgi:hypothetical protein
MENRSVCSRCTVAPYRTCLPSGATYRFIPWPRPCPLQSGGRCQPPSAPSRYCVPARATSSCQGRPTICTPMGSPSGEVSSCTTAPGPPVCYRRAWNYRPPACRHHAMSHAGAPASGCTGMTTTAPSIDVCAQSGHDSTRTRCAPTPHLLRAADRAPSALSLWWPWGRETPARRSAAPSMADRVTGVIKAP